MRRVGAVVAVSLLALAVSACGDGVSSACSMLRDDEAERILGTATRPGEANDETLAPGTNCAWISEGSTDEPHAAVYGVHLWVRTDDEAREEFDRRPRRSDNFRIEPVPKLGDEAYFVVPTEPNSLSGVPSLPYMYVRVGDRIMGIGTFASDERPVDPDEARAMQRATARAALARL